MSSGQEVGEIFGSGAGHATALLRSPTVIIAAVGLWGMNVYLFRLFGIDYAHVLTLDLIKEKEAELKNAVDEANSIVQDVDTSDDGGSVHSIGKVEKRHSPAVLHLKAHATTTTTISSNAPTVASSSNASIGSVSTTNTTALPSSSTSSLSPVSHSNPHDEVTAGKLIFFSIFLLLLLHSTTIFWIDILGGSTIGAIFAFYTAVLIGILLPLPSTSWIRTAVATIFHRAFELVNPRCSCLSSGVPRAIPFIDVFFADAMCSLSKVFFDWGMLWHLAWHYPDAVPMDFEYILIPSLVASLPYLIRARQCLVMFTIGYMKSDPKRYQHMLNAIKYSTSLWPLCVSAYQKTVTSDSEKAFLEKLLIVLLAINSTYSLAWDIVMDWGMMQNPIAVVPESCAPNATFGDSSKNNLSCAQAVLRPRLRFGAYTSIFILLIDTVLRYSWLLRFWESNIFPNSDIYILCTQFLEAVRRALWNLLRVEWENIKQTRGREATAAGADEEAVFENDPFLAPSAITMSPLGRSKQGDDKHES